MPRANRAEVEVAMEGREVETETEVTPKVPEKDRVTKNLMRTTRARLVAATMFTIFILILLQRKLVFTLSNL